MSLWASPILRSCIKHRSVRDLEERTPRATVVSPRSSLLWLIFLLILCEEFSLPGGDPFAVELGEFCLPFFDRLQGLPAAPLGSSEHPFRMRSLSGLWVGNGSHGDAGLFFSTFPKSSWVDPFTVRRAFRQQLARWRAWARRVR